MGYSINREVLEARRDLMAELELGRACRWTTAADMRATKQLAYDIREALYIASLYPQEFPALARARESFSIFVIKPGLIEAKPRSSATAPAVVRHDETPIHGLGPFGREQSTVGKTTATEIVEAWDAHAPSLDPINFQQTTLPPEELRALYNWAIAHTPHLMLLVGDGFLTVSLRDPDVDAFAWHPPQAPPKPEPEYDV